MTRKSLICLSVMLFGGCTLSGDDHQDLEKRCRDKVGVIIHDAELWRQYLAGADTAYVQRKQQWPTTRKVITEYVEGFDQRFGPSLRASRTVV